MPPALDARGLFPPEEQIVVKALACERPVDEKRRPLSRFSVDDVCQRAWDLGIRMSYSTLWRILHRDALRPWLQQQWLFPRDPRLLEKATPILELYQRRWQGAPLGPREFVLCADEMTGLQALSRIHTGLAPGRGRPSRYEFEYERHGALCYLAFLDVFTGRVAGETSPKSGIEPFESALAKVLAQPRYAEAERIFLIVDNGSSHHPSTSPARIRTQFPQVEVVHLPVHSSWLNQIELYFSILQRKALTPADFPSLEALEQRLHWFAWDYNQRAEPFRWNYTRTDLEKYLERLAQKEDLWAEARAALQARREEVAPPNNCLTH
jgi:hypothetical protein